MSHKDLERRRRLAHRGARGRPSGRLRAQGGTEREIKLEVPPDTWAALEAEMSGPDSHAVALHAIYHDTGEAGLAQGRLSLRVRQEGDQWVQTLKAPGSHPLQRLEDNVPLGPAQPGTPPPPVDVARHRPEIVAALRDALGLERDEALPPLHAVFEVRVRRRVRRVVQGRSTIEMALDAGEVLANGRSRPVRELELELVEGDARDLLALARRWRERWGLWVSTTSKAQRGYLLAAGELYAPPAGAAAPAVRGKPDLGAFTAAVLTACLDQVLANASQVAAGSEADDHVHQLRVGLRRLRTALRALPGLDADHARTEAALVEVFRGLGERRDRTHVLRSIQPLVEAAGGSPLRIPAGFHEGPAFGDLVRAPAFHDALLALLSRAELARHGDGGAVRRLLRARLGRLHRQVTSDGKGFVQLPAERQHRARKRLKRLRYLAEFAAPLFPRKAVDRYLARLKPAQDALGEYNDEVMAKGLYEELTHSDAGAAFGVQWLAERRRARARDCRKALRKLEGARPFWSKP